MLKYYMIPIGSIFSLNSTYHFFILCQDINYILFIQVLKSRVLGRGDFGSDEYPIFY